MLGGLLASPAALYPSTFDKNGFFGKYPYIIICALGFISALVGLFLTIFYLDEKPQHRVAARGGYTQLEEDEETVVVDVTASASSSRTTFTNAQLSIRRNNASKSIDDQDNDTSPSTTPPPSTPPTTSRTFTFFSWATMGPIFLYCVIAYVNMTYMTTLPLFYSAPRQDGGLNYDSSKTSISLSILALSKLLVQLFVYDRILVSLQSSSKRTFLLGMGLLVPSHLLMPFLFFMTDEGTDGGYVQFLFTVLSMSVFGFCEALAYLSVILLITESQVPENLGKAHGLASTLAAFARTAAPTIGGSIWEWGVSLEWSFMVFVYGALVSFMGLVAGS